MSTSQHFLFLVLRESVLFLVVGPLRREGGGSKGRATKKKELALKLEKKNVTTELESGQTTKKQLFFAASRRFLIKTKEDLISLDEHIIK